MSELDTLTVHSIAESSASAAVLARLGDRDGALAALERAESRFAVFSVGKPTHARNVRVARETVARARTAVEGMADRSLTAREKLSAVKATGRAVSRAKA